MAKKLIEIFCFLMELQKDLTWIDKIQKVTICLLSPNCIMLSKQSNKLPCAFYGKWLNVKLN